jgi:hypothetical protein
MIKIYALFSAPATTSPFKLIVDDARQSLTQQLPGLQHYRQFERTADQLPGLPDAPYQGSAEFWFNDGDDISHAVNSLTAASSKLPEVFNCDATTVIQGEEHNISGQPWQDSGFKVTFLFNRKSTLALDEFHAYWLNNHGPIAAKTQDGERYVQTHVSAPGRACDGITELFWHDYPTALASMGSEQMRVDQSADAQNFVDRDSLVGFLSQATG